MTECLSEEQIDDFLADCLSDADEQRLDNHLQACAACRELLNQMTAIPGSIHQALVDSKGDDSASDPDLDHLLGRVHFAPTVDGLRLDSDTVNVDATSPAVGQPATTEGGLRKILAGRRTLGARRSVHVSASDWCCVHGPLCEMA